MDNKDKVKNLIESFTGEEAKVVGVPSELIHFVGDAGKALLLAQLIYWSDKGGRKDGLVFKSYKEIYQETGIKEKTCNRYYKEFKAKGFFNWDVKKAYGHPTIHYKLDMDKLTESLWTFWVNQSRQIDRKETVKMSESLTENSIKEYTKEEREEKALSLDKKIEENNKENYQRERNENFELNDDETFTLEDADVIIGEVDFSKDEFEDWEDNNTATYLPDNFHLTEEMNNWALRNARQGIDIEHSTKKFIIYVQGQKRKNWLRNWMLWIFDEQPQSTSKPVKFSANEQRLAELQQKANTNSFANVPRKENGEIDMDELFYLAHPEKRRPQHK